MKSGAAPWIVIGSVLIAISLALSAYVLLGWVVTASTGVASGGQRDFFDAMGWICAGTFVLGVVLLARGIWIWRAARRSKTPT